MKKTTLFCAGGMALFLLLNAGVQYAKAHMSYQFIVKEGELSLLDDINVAMNLSNKWQLELKGGMLSHKHKIAVDFDTSSYFDVAMNLEIDDETEQALTYDEVDDSSRSSYDYNGFEKTCKTLRADLDEATVTAQFQPFNHFDHIYLNNNHLQTSLTMVSTEDYKLYSFKDICDDELDDERSYDIRDEQGMFVDQIKDVNEDQTFFYMPRIHMNMKGTGSIYLLQLQKSELDPNVYYVGSDQNEYYDIAVLNQYDFPVNLDTEAQFAHVNDLNYLFMANKTQTTLTILNEDLQVIDTIPLKYTVEEMKQMVLTLDQDYLIMRVKDRIEVYDVKGTNVFEASIKDLKQDVIDLHYQNGTMYMLSTDQLNTEYSQTELNPNLYAIQNNQVVFHGVIYFHDDTLTRIKGVMNDVSWYDIRFER